jgi:uncharacterized protein (DUF3084 family)
MLTPLILFLGLTVATAIIAYWSDNLGKKLGKKRVSLFGLRPRTTATVLTISSSWLIMLVTLLVLLAVVTPLRNALFSYDRERAQNRRDKEQFSRDINAARALLADARASLAQTGKQYDNAKTALRNARIEVGSARRDLEAAQKRAESAQKGEKAARQGAANAQKLAAVAQRRLTTAQSKFVAAQSRFLGAQNRYFTAQKRASAAQERANAAQGRESLAREGEVQAEEQVRQARANLGQVRGDLNQKNRELGKVNESLTSAKASYERAKKEAIAKANEVLFLESQVSGLNNQIKSLANERNEVFGYASQLESGDVEIPVGRTFAAGIIESGKSQKRIEENLRQLFNKGREALKAPPFELPGYATLELLPYSERIDNKLVVLEGDAAFERVAREIAKSGGATSVRLIAARNVTRNEIWGDEVREANPKVSIDARFSAVVVANAFRAGEVLATQTIDGGSGDADIFNKLQKLTDDGRNEAAQRRVNPPQSPQEQYFYAAGTNVALFAALRRIEAKGKPVTVRLIAADDLSTVEPLRVRFEIEGDSETSSPTTG